MDNHNPNFRKKDTGELKKLLEFYRKKHKEARKAYRSDNIQKWDNKMKEYMEKIRKIEKILFEREEI